MQKKTIGIFYFAGLALWFLSLIIFFLTLASSHSQLNVGSLIIEILVGWIGGILMVISWVGALTNSARCSNWKWFLWLFFFSVFALGVYLYKGPDAKY